MYMNKILQSSVDPEKVSLTIKGIIVSVVPAVMFILGGFGFSVTSTDSTQIISSLIAMETAIMVLYGLGRKIYIASIK